ncbi:MAG: AraC family transcriptional regulator [Lentisphaeria bacterium]|nr:AraC family transcriptional regulator [Lentisphaeria bacterium]
MIDTLFKYYSKRQKELQIGANFIRHSPQNNSPAHVHSDFFELVIVESGTALHVHNNIKNPIGAGEVILIAPGEWHYYENPASFSIYNIIFRPHLLNDFYYDLIEFVPFKTLFGGTMTTEHSKRNIIPLQLSPEIIPEILTACKKLLGYVNIVECGYKTIIMSLFLNILHLIANNCNINTNQDDSDSVKIRQTVFRMQNDLTQKYTLKTLAKSTGMSVTVFQEKFKLIFGVAPIKYLLQLKLEKAKELLLMRSDLTISDIAIKVGLYDGNYLAQRFKKQYNITPSAFKHSILSENKS